MTQPVKYLSTTDDGRTVSWRELPATTSPPVTQPPVTQPPTPGKSGLPAKVNSQWLHRWKGPALRLWPADALAKTDLIVLGLAQHAEPNTGKMEYVPAFNPNPQSPEDHASDIRNLVSQGKNVLMGFGGSGVSIAITNSTQVAQATASMVGFVDRYGITGMDIDIEPSGSSWDVQALADFVAAMRQKYGPSFIVGITPGLYAPYSDKWFALVNKIGTANYDYMAPMLYDFPEAKDSRLVGVTVSKCDLMHGAGIPDDHMILGFMTQPFAGYSATPTIQLMKDSHAAAKAKYPKLRGAFHWESSIDASKNWQFARQMGDYLHA